MSASASAEHVGVAKRTRAQSTSKVEHPIATLAASKQKQAKKKTKKQKVYSEQRSRNDAATASSRGSASSELKAAAAAAVKPPKELASQVHDKAEQKLEFDWRCGDRIRSLFCSVLFI